MRMILQGPKNSKLFKNLLKYYLSSLRMIPQGQQGQYLYPNFTGDKTETGVQVACSGQTARQYFLTV